MTVNLDGDGASGSRRDHEIASEISLQTTISVQMMLLLKEPRNPAAVKALAHVLVEECMAARTRIEAQGFARTDTYTALNKILTAIYLRAAEQVIHADLNGSKSLYSN